MQEIIRYDEKQPEELQAIPKRCASGPHCDKERAAGRARLHLNFVSKAVGEID